MDKKLLPLVVIGVVALVVGGAYYFWKGRGISIGTGDYQAVFLTNDQVYFGKIVKSTPDEIVLQDVYYLIIRRPLKLQPQTPESTPSAQQGPRYELRHLGDREPHGPTSEMRINRNQVLFIEKLREDGMVVQGIKKYKAQQQQQQ